MTEMYSRRCHAVYSSLASSPDDSSNSNHGAEAGSGLFNGLYTALGGWLIEPPTQMMANAVPDPAQSIAQVIENMGNWALRGVMLNMCLPVSLLPTPAISRSQSPTELVAAAMQPLNGINSSSSSSRIAAAAADNCDALRSPGRQDTEKHVLGLGVKPLGGNSRIKVMQPAIADAATNTCSDSNDATAAHQEHVERLRREVSCLRTTLGTMYLTCAHLQEENQRLRSGDGGEELLSDALQQLLTEKSALQQEVSSLRMQNKALQELLHYAAAPAGSSDVLWNSSSNYGWHNTVPDTLQACCGSSSSLYNMQHEAGVADIQQQQQCGYWLATPAGSVAQSASSSGRSSPAGSSINSSTGRMCDSKATPAECRSLQAASAGECEQFSTAAAQSERRHVPAVLQAGATGAALPAATVLTDVEPGSSDAVLAAVYAAEKLSNHPLELAR